VIFQYFPGLGIFKKKFQDFSGGVGTLIYSSAHLVEQILKISRHITLKAKRILIYLSIHSPTEKIITLFTYQNGTVHPVAETASCRSRSAMYCLVLENFNLVRGRCYGFV